MTFKALRQHIVKFHTHYRVETEYRLIEKYHSLAAGKTYYCGDHSFHSQRQSLEFFPAVKFKAFCHFGGKLTVVIGINLRCDIEQFSYGEIKVPREVFNIAHSRVHCRGGNRPSVHGDFPFGDVLITRY